MPRNGSGSYGLPAGNPFVPNTVISSTTMNNTMNDIGTALTQSIANDGQTTPVANLPMATFRHTNVGNAVARNDYAAAGQVQDSVFHWLTSVAGTNTITASITPSPTAYTAGQTFRFVAVNTNSGAVTLNINGLGAKAVTKSGAVPVVAGDIISTAVVSVVYDGTQFQIITLPQGNLIGVQTFTANGTYTPTQGTQSIVVIVQGAGGGGGGSDNTAAGQLSTGSGGNSGSIGASRLMGGFSGASVTIGAGGTAGAIAGAGGAGGATSFGAFISAPGGEGGGFSLAAAPPNLSPSTNNAAVATGGNIYNSSTGTGGNGFMMNLGSAISGNGANSHFGNGPRGNNLPGNGGNATNKGCGGGGGLTGSASGGNTGGTGAPGFVVIYEYS